MMKRSVLFVFISMLVLSGYAKTKWDIDVTEIKLDYLVYDSKESLTKQLNDIQKNKEFIKSNKVFTTLWDKNHTDNYLNSTKFIECAVTHDLAQYYLDSSYNSFPKEWQLNYKNFSRKNYVLSDLENQYKKYYKVSIDETAISDYKKALSVLKDLGLYNVIYFSEMGSKESYDLALNEGGWVTEFNTITQKWPVQNMEIVSAIIKENGFDTTIPYLNEIVAFSLYLTIYYGSTISQNVSSLYGSSIPEYSYATLTERNKILASNAIKEKNKPDDKPSEVKQDSTVATEKSYNPYSEEAIQKEYSYISNPDIFNNRIVKSKDGLYGLINQNNKNVILCLLESLFYDNNLGCYVGKNGVIIVYYDKNGNLIKSETAYDQNDSYYSNNSGTSSSTSSAMADLYKKWADDCFRSADFFYEQAEWARTHGDSILYQLNKQKGDEQRRKGNEYLKLAQ